MEALGTIIEQHEDYLIINGNYTFTKNNTMPGVQIDCEESGSTLRFMVPISLLKENKVRFIGRGQLGKRPLDTCYEIFERQNIGYLYRENVLDLNVVGELKRIFIVFQVIFHHNLLPVYYLLYLYYHLIQSLKLRHHLKVKDILI